MAYSPGSSESERAAKANARDFADLVGRIINTTVSETPISFVEIGGEDLGYIAHCKSRIVPAPLPLSNGHYLFVYQLLGLRREENYLTTLQYKYSYQASERDDSWIFRYEYEREPEPGYEYPLSHLHVNATPEQYAGEKEFPRLHLPAGERVTIESVVRHLICEHGVKPISREWEEVLDGAEAAFAEIQKKRVLDPES